jgi:CheY-like chemotaxis protein
MRANGLLKGRRVLVAEDEAVTALMIEDALEDAGCIVVGPVASVHDALALVESEQIDCAILDIELIDGQCGPVADALIRRGRRIVFTTGYAPSTIDLPYASGPILGKAFDIADLLGMVENIFDRDPADVSAAREDR